MARKTYDGAVDAKIGERIRFFRKRRGIGQKGLAAQLGLTYQQVQKYECGANRVSASMLVRIAAILETTVGSLVGEEPLPLEVLDRVALEEPGVRELLETFAQVYDPRSRLLVQSLAEHFAQLYQEAYGLFAANYRSRALFPNRELVDRGSVDEA